jgi:hypothetical protein
MKKTLAALIVASLATVTAQAAVFIGSDLISLGSSGIGTLDPSSTATFLQTSNATSFSGTAALSDTFYNENVFAAVNWTSATGLYIRSTITTNPNLPFTVRLYDSLSLELASYSGSTNSFTTGTNQSDSATYSYLNLTPNTTPILSGITYFQFTFDGDAATDMTLHAVSTAAVPEPSTYALLSIGALGLFLSFRRRKVQA